MKEKKKLEEEKSIIIKRNSRGKKKIIQPISRKPFPTKINKTCE